MAVAVTLLVAAVSGFAIWQGDVQAATVATAGPAVVAAPDGAAPRRAAESWLRTFVEQLRDRELTIDLRRGDHSLSLQITWRERAPVVAGHAR